jgi:hypothetical protein
MLRQNNVSSGMERDYNKRGVEFMVKKFQSADLNEHVPPRGSGPPHGSAVATDHSASPHTAASCAVQLLPQIVILRSLRNIGKEWRYPTLQPLPPACLQSPLPAFLPSALSTLQCVRLEQRNRGRELASCDRLASIGRYTIRVPVFLIALTPSAFTT